MLGRLRDFADEDAWRPFVQRFRAPLVAFGHKLGLPAADAEDVAQETLLDFARSYRVNGTVRGGTERLRYFASGGYNHVDDLFNGQDIGQGYQPGYSYDRINVRSNFDVKVTSTTNLKVNFYGIQTFQSSIPGYQVNGFYASISGIPANSMVHRYEDGVYGAYNPDILSPNPMYEINLGGLDGDLHAVSELAGGPDAAL